MISGVLGAVAELAREARDAAVSAARVAVHHVATAGDLRRLWRNVQDINARLAALEPRGDAVGLCRVCGGSLHVCAVVTMVDADTGAPFRRTVLRCARCWALRPVDRPGTGAAPAGEVGR